MFMASSPSFCSTFFQDPPWPDSGLCVSQFQSGFILDLLSPSLPFPKSKMPDCWYWLFQSFDKLRKPRESSVPIIAKRDLLLSQLPTNILSKSAAYKLHDTEDTSR